MGKQSEKKIKCFIEKNSFNVTPLTETTTPPPMETIHLVFIQLILEINRKCLNFFLHEKRLADDVHEQIDSN